MVLPTIKKVTKRRSMTSASEDDSPLRRGGAPKIISKKKQTTKQPKKSDRSVPSSAVKVTPDARLPKKSQVIRDFFGMLHTTKSNFPGKKVCHEGASFEVTKNGKRVVVFVASVLQVICEIIIPNDSDGCIRAVGNFLLDA